MNHGDISLACATSLVDGLVDGGVRARVALAGIPFHAARARSRRDPRVQVHVQLDERSGGFFALGAAKATGRPAIVACTSGTAAAELLPAVVEASQSRVPLDRADRGPSASPPRDGSEPDDRAAGALRRLRPRVLRPAGAVDGRAGSVVAPGGARGDPGDGHRPDRPGAPELPVRGAAHPDRRASPAAARTRSRSKDANARSAELDPDETDRLTELVSGETRRRSWSADWPGHLRGGSHFWSELLGWPVLAEPTSGDRDPEIVPRRRPGPDRRSLVGGTSPRRRDPVRRVPDERSTQRFVASAEHRVVADRWHLDPDPGAPRVVAAGGRSGRASGGARLAIR